MAIVRAPNAFPQTMSWPVSPMTSTCAGRNFSPVSRLRARQREGAELVAIVMVIRKRSEGKEMPQLIMLEF